VSIHSPSHSWLPLRQSLLMALLSPLDPAHTLSTPPAAATEHMRPLTSPPPSRRQSTGPFLAADSPQRHPASFPYLLVPTLSLAGPSTLATTLLATTTAAATLLAGLTGEATTLPTPTRLSQASGPTGSRLLQRLSLTPSQSPQARLPPPATPLASGLLMAAPRHRPWHLLHPSIRPPR
jgi:hypothetical protein